MHSAQQELYTRLLTALKAHFEPKGYKVYDGFLPPDNVPYPFVYMGDFRQLDTTTKKGVYGRVFPTVHIWHNSPYQRGTLSDMLLETKIIMLGITRTENFSWAALSPLERIIPDNTTNTPLFHGIVEAEFIHS